ncbi:MAG: shikimate dehydrogenase [Deltaproteobacteria bacterium]|nr:shikimate dehydrogenase [Deltaproteobacteria bacterium]
MIRLLLIGWPVGHSRSPAMHRAALSAHHLDGTYELFPAPPADLAEAVEVLREDPDVAGFNVTVPHKQSMIDLVDHVEPLAKQIGAVNTVIRQGSLLVGANTDADGFLRALQEAGGDPTGPALVIGAGGAARAVVAGLVRAGASRVDVAARRIGAAKVLVDSLVDGDGRALDIANLAVAFGGAKTIVQATSATMDPEVAESFADALPWDALQPGTACMDLVYEPLETTFLARAREAGGNPIDGLGMLLHQGALAFERWTNRRAPLEVMREALFSGGI